MLSVRRPSDEGNGRRGQRMMAACSDTLVVFGVSGDLAHKMISPALCAKAKRDRLNVPIIGVASGDRSRERLHERVTDSIEHSGETVDKGALEHFLSLMTYVSGDYADPNTFISIKQALAKALARRCR